jgi:hypothetical protein
MIRAALNWLVTLKTTEVIVLVRSNTKENKGLRSFFRYGEKASRFYF